jgi:cobalt-zinc-cadmium efflux system protein
MPTDHDTSPSKSEERKLGFAFAVVGAFMIAEGLGGWFFHSLTLLADAGHMLLDASALWLAWYALRLTRRASDERLSYGYHRFPVLAAFINGLSLIALCGWILFEALVRMGSPVAMQAAPALAIAVLGLFVNWVALRLLHGGATHDHRHEHDDAHARVHEHGMSLNVRAAHMHVMGDLLGSIAAIVAAATALTTGWPYADPLLAFGIVAILLRGAIRVLLDSGHILLEGVPKHLDLEDIRRALTERVTAVRDVHHLHAWALTTERPLVTLHATLREGSDARHVVRDIKLVLHERFGIDHSTIQLDHGPCPDDQ